LFGRGGFSPAGSDHARKPGELFLHRMVEAPRGAGAVRLRLSRLRVRAAPGAPDVAVISPLCPHT